MNAKVRGRAYMTDSASHGTISIFGLLEYVEPRIVRALDKNGARIHLLRTELCNRIESFLNHPHVDRGDIVIVIASTHGDSVILAITKAITAKSPYIHVHKLQTPACTSVLGIVKRLSF